MHGVVFLVELADKCFRTMVEHLAKIDEQYNKFNSIFERTSEAQASTRSRLSLLQLNWQFSGVTMISNFKQFAVFVYWYIVLDFHL